MKRLILFILVLFSAYILSAQTDTLRWQESPWYLFPQTSGTISESVTLGLPASLVHTQHHYCQVLRYYDTVPCKVYGVGVTRDIIKDSFYAPYDGTDSLLWGLIGTHTRLGKIDVIPTLELKLMDFCSFQITQEKGAMPGSNMRQESFIYHWRRYSSKYSDCHEPFETDTVVSVLEFYFDSAHSFNANDTFYVGGYNKKLFHHLCCIDTRGDAVEDFSEGNYYLLPMDGQQGESFDLSQCAVGDTVTDGFCYNMVYKYNSMTQTCEYAIQCGPFFPIIELRCTTPKAVRWTAIGSDTARFEWQLHDEAENFIVEVEDMIANTTTHDTLPNWQNYYTLHGLDTNTDCLQLRVQKSTRYTMKYYDTVVYSPWYELPLLGHLPEPPDTTTPIDTTQPVDTNQGILMAQGLQFSLQPNPVHDKAEVQLAAPADEGCTATITDLSGRELQRITVPPATQSLTIDLTTLPAGTYLLTLATPTATSTQRLVKGL